MVSEEEDLGGSLAVGGVAEAVGGADGDEGEAS